jgi:hypothetical protein
VSCYLSLAQKGTQEKSSGEIPSKILQSVSFFASKSVRLSQSTHHSPAETAAGGRRVSSRQRGSEQPGISHAIMSSHEKMLERPKGFVFVLTVPKVKT